VACAACAAPRLSSSSFGLFVDLEIRMACMGHVSALYLLLTLFWFMHTCENLLRYATSAVRWKEDAYARQGWDIPPMASCGCVACGTLCWIIVNGGLIPFRAACFPLHAMRGTRSSHYPWVAKGSDHGLWVSCCPVGAFGGESVRK